MRETTEPTLDEHGNQVHPAFGLIGASRASVSGGPEGGAILFDSDVAHNHTVRIRIKAATRKRDLHHDWVFGGHEYIEVELSEAQWASFVSSMNTGDGVPCTVRYIDHKMVPELPHEARLAQTMQETSEAADAAYDGIKKAMANYEAVLDAKAPAKDRRDALRTLDFAIANAASNVNFAGQTLVKQTENVVTKARADIEAFVVIKARQLGIDPAELGGEPFAIGAALIEDDAK